MTPAKPAGHEDVPELLPCPFCGGVSDDTHAGGNPRLEQDSHTNIYVWCPSCGAKGLVVVGGHGGTFQEAITAWNSRAKAPAQATDVAEAIVQMIERRWRTWEGLPAPTSAMNRSYSTAAKIILQDATALYAPAEATELAPDVPDNALLPNDVLRDNYARAQAADGASGNMAMDTSVAMAIIAEVWRSRATPVAPDVKGLVERLRKHLASGNIVFDTNGNWSSTFGMSAPQILLTEIYEVLRRLSAPPAEAPSAYLNSAGIPELPISYPVDWRAHPAEHGLTPLYKHPAPPAEAKPVAWRCFHCDEVFTDEAAARDHFGRDQASLPACQIKSGAERSLVRELRRAEEATADAIHRMHDESTEGFKAYYAAASRHGTQLQAAEEAGYERGLADALIHPDHVKPLDEVALEAAAKGLAVNIDDRYVNAGGIPGVQPTYERLSQQQRAVLLSDARSAVTAYFTAIVHPDPRAKAAEAVPKDVIALQSEAAK